MAHEAGQRYRCEECGAEIVFIRPCPCPEDEPKAHPDICCDRKMTDMGVIAMDELPRPHAGA